MISWYFLIFNADQIPRVHSFDDLPSVNALRLATKVTAIIFSELQHTIMYLALARLIVSTYRVMLALVLNPRPWIARSRLELTRTWSTQKMAEIYLNSSLHILLYRLNHRVSDPVCETMNYMKLNTWLDNLQFNYWISNLKYFACNIIFFLLNLFDLLNYLIFDIWLYSIHCTINIKLHADQFDDWCENKIWIFCSVEFNDIFTDNTNQANCC